MSWDWSRMVELGGLVVTIVSLHFSNKRYNEQTRKEQQDVRDAMTQTITELKTKMDFVYGWVRKRAYGRGSSTESDDAN